MNLPSPLDHGRYEHKPRIAAARNLNPLPLLLLCMMFVVAGCVHQVTAPPPSFAPPVVRLPGQVTLPKATPPVGRGPVKSGPVRSGPVTGRVVIDPGHGGKDPGAQVFGIDEKAINLAVARLVAERLSARGVTVILTRKSDVFIELQDRADASTSYRADLFVSVHADSNPSPEKEGHSVLLPQSGDPQANLAGQLIDRHMTANGSPSHIVRMDNRGLLVLRRTTCPAVLVELGFLSNRTEARRLASSAYQQSLAEGIADGIVDYLARN